MKPVPREPSWTISLRLLLTTTATLIGERVRKCGIPPPSLRRHTAAFLPLLSQNTLGEVSSSLCHTPV